MSFRWEVGTEEGTVKSVLKGTQPGESHNSLKNRTCGNIFKKSNLTSGFGIPLLRKCHGSFLNITTTETTILNFTNISFKLFQRALGTSHLNTLNIVHYYEEHSHTVS